MVSETFFQDLPYSTIYVIAACRLVFYLLRYIPTYLYVRIVAFNLKNSKYVVFRVVQRITKILDHYILTYLVRTITIYSSS